MEDNLKMTIAGNISKLRQYNGMTQLELAERLNYSDKAISKWERGEAIPDISVLMNIASLFGVKLDYLVEEHSKIENIPLEGNEKFRYKKHALILGMCILLVWLIASFAFVVLHIAYAKITGEWLAFVYAVPVTMIVWLVLNSIWFSTRKNYLIISLLMWTILAAVFLTFLWAGYNVWLIFVLGIPGQFITILWSNIGRGNLPGKK